MGSKEKEAIVIVLDVGHSMNQAPPGSCTTLETARDVITMILQRKVFSESKDEVALILFGTPGSANKLDYDNITVERPFRLADLDLIQHIRSNIQPSQESGDCILVKAQCCQVQCQRLVLTICTIASVEPLRLKHLLDFDPNKFCTSNIGLISLISLTIVCFIAISIITYHNRWYMKYKIFLLRLAAVGYREMQDAREHDDFEFDLNIIFYDDDEVWVREHFRPALVEHLPQFRRNVFGDEDLVLGMHYLDAVDYVVTHSYKTIIVLSRAAVRDRWFVLKFRTAMDHVSDNLTEFVMVVFLEDIHDDEMPFLVRLYLRDGRPYIHWTEDVRGQGYFWNKLTKYLTINLRTNDMLPNE
nr:toll-like receptor 4 [Lytechinus pictus]